MTFKFVIFFPHLLQVSTTKWRVIKKIKRKKESYQKCSRIHTKIINSLGWNKDFQWQDIFYILVLAKN